MAYKDIFNNFVMHPDTHDLAVKTGSRATAQSLRNLILTNRYERPMRSTVGGDVRRLLFENISDQTGNALQAKIKETLKNHAKQIIVKEVTVVGVPQYHRYDVTIEYYELNNPTVSAITIQLNRVR